MRIINKYRNPATIFLTAGAGIITGVVAYNGARRGKMLEQGAELSYIKRLELEREAERNAGKDTAIDTAAPDRTYAEKTVREKATSQDQAIS